MSQAKQAKLVLRQLDRRVQGGVPASDLGELEMYVEEAYRRLKDRTSERFDPQVYATSLAERAARVYAKKEYTGTREFEREFERAASRWANQAATEYHRDDLTARPHETTADRLKRDLGDQTRREYLRDR